MEDNNCRDCFHMKVKIPVQNFVLQYKKAVAKCALGLIINVDGKEKRFRLGQRKVNYSGWSEYGKACADFQSMVDNDL